jgi:hypothetical protein
MLVGMTKHWTSTMITLAKTSIASFSVSDAWLQPGNPPSLKDHFQLRRVAKAWLRYNYNSLLKRDASTKGSKIIQTLPAKSRPQAHVHRLLKRRNG